MQSEQEQSELELELELELAMQTGNKQGQAANEKHVE